MNCELRSDSYEELPGNTSSSEMSFTDDGDHSLDDQESSEYPFIPPSKTLKVTTKI